MIRPSQHAASAFSSSSVNPRETDQLRAGVSEPTTAKPPVQPIFSLAASSFDRSASFRRSFLVSYAVRISERLTESAGRAASSYGAELVPVMQLTSRGGGPRFERLFLHTHQVCGLGQYSQRGWQAGRKRPIEPASLLGGSTRRDRLGH